MLYKNVASQKIHVYAYDSTTGEPKTGDAAQITAYVSLDGTANAVDDAAPTEVDSTNMPGIYAFDLTQAETNCDAFALYAKSSTANIRLEPIIGFTTKLAVDANGKVAVPDTQKVDVGAWKGSIPADLADTDKVQVSLQHVPEDQDMLALMDALRQGYDSTADVIVAYATTAAGRGTNFLAAITAANALTTPHGVARSATNRTRIFIPPFVHDVAGTGAVASEEYVDFMAIYPEEGGSRQPSDSDWGNGTTSLDSYRPPRTVVCSTSSDVSPLTQSASDVRMTGFAISQLSGDSTGTYDALAITADNPAASIYDRMYFWHKAPLPSYSNPRCSVGFSKHVGGTWHKCKANAYAWRVAPDLADESQFSAVMYDCEAGAFSYMGDYPYGYEGTRKATNCHLERCKCIGTYNTSDATQSGYGAFAGCALFGLSIDNSCVLIDCEAGNNSYGIGAKNEALMIRCRGGDYCCGATVLDDYPGEFAGIDIGGVYGKGSCGGRKAGITVGKLTGTIRGTTILSSELSHRIEGATIEDCLLTVDTTNQDCVTLLDSTSRIHNSTLLVVEGGTGIPINAASALSVSAKGNRYNNVGVATNGLGANVTNVGAADTVTTDAASRTASRATSVTVSDKTGFSLSEAAYSRIYTDAETAVAAYGGSTHSADDVVTALGTGSTLTDCATATSVTVSNKTGFKLASDGADLVLVDGKTLPAAMQIIAAGVAGKVSGAGSGTEVFVGLDGLTTRITVTADSSGNRTEVTY